MLALTVVVAGALLAGLLLPWVGGPALVAQQSTSLLGDPPLELTDEPPAGQHRDAGRQRRGDHAPSTRRTGRRSRATQIAEVMKQAMVAIEDARFYEHGGLDVQGTLRALVTNVAAGEVQEGGSTLTQQLVKQTLLQSADTARGARRPPPSRRSAASSARRGWRWRWRTPTARTSCSPATSTSSTSGRTPTAIQPAARAFFGVDASALTLTQAALLAGLVQSPSDDDPFTNPEGATIRRNQVLDRMADAGLHHAGGGGRGGGRTAGPRPGPGPAPRLRARRASAPTSATSCSST